MHRGCRFYAEEQFSFRVRELAPGALRVLDMQDFHALRAGAGTPALRLLHARTNCLDYGLVLMPRCACECG